MEAEGNTDSRPLPGFTPRKGKGLPIFGKSKSGPPARKVIRHLLSAWLSKTCAPDYAHELDTQAYACHAQDMRIDFQFDTAAFAFKFLPFKVPYPVPFKLLGDEIKARSALLLPAALIPTSCGASAPLLLCSGRACLQGWLDITYLSPDGRFRLSRGNKGTLFVLARDVPLQEQLLEAVASRSSDAQVQTCMCMHVQSPASDAPHA